MDPNPGIAVALHSCGNQYEGDSQNYFRTSADEHGFIIIAPTNGTPDCWNATAGEAGEKPDIVRMVEWVLENYDADPARVYVGGASSGACMTVALLAAHPDVFAGGTMMAGVPYGAWSGGNSCGVCSQAPSPRSEQEWGDIVRNDAPQGFTGPWPRLQVWHGDADTTLRYGWESETEKQWKNLWGLTGTGAMVAGPSGWNRTQYEADGKVVLEVNRGPGKDHYLPDDIPQGEMIAFFGLDQEVSEPGGETTDGGDDTDGGTDTTGTIGADTSDTSTSGGGTSTGDGTSGGGTSSGGSTTSGGDSGASGTPAEDDEGLPEDASTSGGDDDDNDGTDEGGSSNEDAGGKRGCSVQGQAAPASPMLALLWLTGIGGMVRRARRKRNR